MAEHGAAMLSHCGTLKFFNLIAQLCAVIVHFHH